MSHRVARPRSRSRSPRQRHGRSRSRSRSRSPHRRHEHSHSRSRSPKRTRGSDQDNSPAHSKDTRKLSKEEKERLKATETPEEKRQRRLAKKAAKDVRRQERGEEPKSTGGVYSALDNPFGDQNINERFVWHKKYESLETQGVSRDDVMRRERKLRSENEIELDRVRKAREQRELEKTLIGQEQDRMLRDRENDQFSKWISQEETFHLNQARQRTEIRLREGRAKPIDIAAQYIHTNFEELDISVHEPFTVFNGLCVEDLEDMSEDIKVYARLERDTNPEYWQDMAAICEHELTEKRREAAARDPTISAAERRALETGISPQVRETIMKMLRGKTYSELLTLQEEIRKRISSGDAVDISFWEAMLGEMKAQLARARLRERHQALLQKTLSSLRFHQQNEPQAAAPTDAEEVFTESDLLAAESAGAAAPATGGAEEAPAAPRLLRSFSPTPVPLESLGAIAVLDAAEDEKRIKTMRQDVMQRLKSGRLATIGPVAVKAGMNVPAPSKGSGAGGAAAAHVEALRAAMASDDANVDSSDLAAVMYKAEEDRGMGEDEETFNEDVAVATKYSWAAKHRPRKPRFFNRVMTGFEWNQYNRTHYDVDNPPPKVVQGYKFNIFYPDLIDKSKSPTFTVTRLADEPGFSTICFHAGPPYEDIAFKIVDLPWLYGRRTGFRCQFDRNNIFQLWFCFRRERYRR